MSFIPVTQYLQVLLPASLRDLLMVFSPLAHTTWTESRPATLLSPCCTLIFLHASTALYVHINLNIINGQKVTPRKFHRRRKQHEKEGEAMKKHENSKKTQIKEHKTTHQTAIKHIGRDRRKNCGERCSERQEMGSKRGANNQHAREKKQPLALGSRLRRTNPNNNSACLQCQHACGAQTLLTVWGCLRRVWLLVSWSFGCWFVALFNLFYDRTYSMGCHQGKDPTARLSRRGCNKARPATSTHVYCSFFCSPLSSLLAFSFVLTPIFFQNSSTKQQQQNLLAVVILHHEDRFPSFHPSGRSGLCSFT